MRVPLPRLVLRSYCSRSSGLRGADSLMTPKERESRKTAQSNDAATMRIRQAQLARQRNLSELYDVELPADSGGSVSMAQLDAKLAALERSGEFKNLAGAGKPLPERARTHFGNEDAIDSMMTRIMAENNVKPESVEIRTQYQPRLKAFRARLQQQQAEPRLDANTRASLAHEMSELQKLRAAYTTAAVKDSLTYNLPINPLPKLAATLEEELAAAHSPSKSVRGLRNGAAARRGVSTLARGLHSYQAAPSRELDIVVYGASGFTGRLVASYLARHGGVRIGLAGRSLQKLKEARDEIASATLVTNSGTSFDPPLLAVDSTEYESLLALAARTRVLISTAGPYSVCGTPVVGACAAAGTDYLDINGETPWVREIVSTYDDMAAEKSTLLIPNCGFNVLADLGTFDAISRLRSPAQSVRCYMQFNGRLSGGTMATGIHLDSAGEHVQAARRDPFLLGGAPLVTGSDGAAARAIDADPTCAEYDEDLECWTAPFWLADIDSRVVRRTCGLFREAAIALCADVGGDGGAHLHGYGDQLVYRERQLAPDEGVAKNWAAPLPAVERRQRLIDRGKLPAPGQGPSEAVRATSWFRMFLYAESADQRDGVLTSVEGGDPGYTETSKVVAEAALLLATRRDELPAHPRERNHHGGGGVLTPAFALGAPMRQALCDAGLEFESRVVVGEEEDGTTVADVARVLREALAEPRA